MTDEPDRGAASEPEDLERLARAAYLTGRDDESEVFLARAHQLFLARGDLEAAARSACWLGFGLTQRGARAPAAGWLSRAERILDEAQIDSVVRGYLLIFDAIRLIVSGDPEGGHAAFARAAEIASRFADRDLASLACQGRGRALIYLGRTAEGVTLLDEAMTAVVAGEVSPIQAGDIYCSLLEACQELFDLRRAYEWTTSFARWCGEQPRLVRYRGECLLYRAEVRQLRGQWDEAAEDAQGACALLMSRPMAGAAYYRLGEIHRLRGEHAEADAAFTRANELGRKPQPGLSLLRLQQGRIEAAATSVRAVLADTQAPPARVRLLAAAVEILLAAHDVDHARAAAEELTRLAGVSEARMLQAMCAQATGAVLLADEDVGAASASLQRARETWRALEAPYEEAQTCLLMAAACERRGDQEGRRLELAAARRLFQELKAESRLSALAGPPAAAASPLARPLSKREAQVLRLLATGKTNRDIGEALFISEKTVARHVSNIFDKLGVSTRAGATALAYQRNLIEQQ